jgi:hypothetical protein
MSSTLISLCKWFLLSLLTLQIDFACDADGEVENPDVAQVSELFVAVDNSCGSCVMCAFHAEHLTSQYIILSIWFSKKTKSCFYSLLSQNFIFSLVRVFIMLIICFIHGRLCTWVCTLSLHLCR